MNRIVASLDSLPEEILINIFQYCDVQDLGRLSYTSKSVSRVASDSYLWKSLYYKDSLNQPPESSLHYKDIYRTCLSKNRILFLEGAFTRLRKIVYQKETSVLELQDFIFNKWLSDYREIGPFNATQVNVLWFKRGYEGPMLSSDKKLADYDLPTKTILRLRFSGFIVYF